MDCIFNFYSRFLIGGKLIMKDPSASSFYLSKSDTFSNQLPVVNIKAIPRTEMWKRTDCGDIKAVRTTFL